VLGPARRVVVAREITKIHEEFLRGKARDIVATLKSKGDVKGEITLLIAKPEKSAESRPPRVSIRDRLEQLMRDEQLDEKTALKKVAKELGVSKSEAYRQLQRSK
jgi:16S rRNA (cytidine1402-2'-O)-methyltransferase